MADWRLDCVAACAVFVAVDELIKVNPTAAARTTAVAISRPLILVFIAIHDLFKSL